MNQVEWNPLRPKGLIAKPDKIASIALSDHAVQRTVTTNLKKFAAQCGVDYAVGQHISAAIHGYAATDSQKIADLQQVMQDPDVRVVTCATGGYSISNFLRRNGDQVLRLFEADPKLWTGYSDAGVLSMFLLAHLNLVSASTPNMWGLYSDWNEHSRQRMQEVFTGRANSLYLDHSWKPFREGEAEGVIIVANMGTLCRSIGTISDPLIGLAEKGIPVILVGETFSTTLDEVVADLDQIFDQRKKVNFSAFVLGGRSPGMFAGPYREFHQKNSLTSVMENGLPPDVPWGIYNGFGHPEFGRHAGYKPRSEANLFMETIPFGVWGKIILGSECQLSYDCPVVV